MVLSIRNKTTELSFRRKEFGIGIFIITIKTLKQAQGDIERIKDFGEYK